MTKEEKRDMEKALISLVHLRREILGGPKTSECGNQRYLDHFIVSRLARYNITKKRW